ncbi:sigma-54 dependent transcriptional regulator [Microbulbifer sp. RZ01]|uniref:sigma-54-dependent transcriptional regulator n=1 Tax=Microbulbifer sp. RZ01 TaxID=3021711 RepID=UPI0027E563FE|nr:sigma-54 dependent transcriptional regulator [Microbulbifer sp. RZ01]
MNTEPTTSPGGPIAYVDDEKYIRDAVRQLLELHDYTVETFDSAEKVLPKLTPEWPGILISDINMPGMDGLALTEHTLKIDRGLPVILLTGHGDISMAVNAIRNGAYDFIEKPFDNEHLLEVVHRALEKRQLTLENRKLKAEVENFAAPGPRILGNTPAIRQMRELIHRVLDTPADILLFGETGTGKDLVARYLHDHSARRDKNFVAINCGALPESIIESELFGYEAGAFTGADKRRIGKFEYANGGTLFLDEIESMPLTLQVKLLRVLEERQVERLGSNQQISLDIRVIAATKEDLLALSDSGKFRRDLYYRLNLVTIPIPPLRERREDIPLLFQHFAVVASARHHRELIPLNAESMARLKSQEWPGNVRELRNLAERYVLLGASALNSAPPFSDPQEDLHGRQTLQERVEQFERTLIEEALQRHQGSIKDSMVSLGLPRKTLYDKMKKYGLDRRDFISNTGE